MGKAKEAGIDLGMARTVGYGGYSAPLGGGSVGIIGKDHTDQEIAAAWEFVKFLMSDQQVAANHIETGVLPTTYSSVETDTLKDFWADENHIGYKISYEQGCFRTVYVFIYVRVEQHREECVFPGDPGKRSGSPGRSKGPGQRGRGLIPG